MTQAGRMRPVLVPCWLLGLAMMGSCGDPAPVMAPEESSPPVLRRLTDAQFHNAVHDLFGEDIFIPSGLEPDVRFQGLQSIGASVTPISPRGMEQYEEASYVIAGQALDEAHRGQVVTCTPSGAGDTDCASETLAAWGPRIWRRPLTADEQQTLLSLFTASADVLDDFYEALVFPFAMLLQSPDFLMRPEFGMMEAETGLHRYTGYEMASRLSFLMWNSIPDDELLAAAERGDLDTVAGVDAAAQRLWASERSREGVRAWASDLLHLDGLDELRKDPTVFVHMDDAVGPAAREETLLGIEHLIFDQDTDFRSFVNTRETFIDRTLSAIYDVRAPAREGFGKAELDASEPRRGFLGQVSFLALNAHPVSSSPTLRGQFVREVMLCQVLPDPPAGVDTSIPAVTTEAPTLRDRVQSHLEQPGCSACHELTDLIGLSLENFDGLGVYRELDNGVPIDASGGLDGAVFDDAAGLADALYAHPNFGPCLVKQLARYGLGRLDEDGDEAVLDWLSERFATRDHRMQPLWLDLVSSPLFRYVGEVTE